MCKLETRIEECIVQLREFGFIMPIFFAPAIDRVIKALEEIDSLTRNLGEKDRKRALGIVTEFLNQAAAYQGYISGMASIDRLISNLRYIKRWLVKQEVET